MALDATVEAIAEAHAIGANLLVTHHPAYLDAPSSFAPEASAAARPGAEVWAAIRFTAFAFVMIAALGAIFTLVSLLQENRAVSAVVCIFLAYFLLFLGIYLHARLTEPAMMPAQEYVENGEIFCQAAYPNPGYVQGLQRAVYTGLCALPGCQAVWLAATAAAACPWQLLLASLLAAAAVTGAGLVLFRRKDLK